MATPLASDSQKKSMAAKVSKSGIITDADGNSHIPSSVRADGSVRKEIRIRPGYRPPEDVEVYRNRTAEAWRNRGNDSGVIPGAEIVKSKDEKEGDAKGKNAKRRDARKKAAAAKAAEAAEEDKRNDGKKHDEKNEQVKETKPEEVVPEDVEAEKQKEAKKLLKKLRQARELKDKKDQGGALLPEQFEKVIRINELIRQLDGLGFDSNGEKKGEQEAQDDT